MMKRIIVLAAAAGAFPSSSCGSAAPVFRVSPLLCVSAVLVAGQLMLARGEESMKFTSRLLCQRPPPKLIQTSVDSNLVKPKPSQT